MSRFQARQFDLNYLQRLNRIIFQYLSVSAPKVNPRHQFYTARRYLIKSQLALQLVVFNAANLRHKIQLQISFNIHENDLDHSQQLKATGLQTSPSGFIQAALAYTLLTH